MKKSQGFRKLLADFPKQFPAGLEAAKSAFQIPDSRFKIPKASHIIICGMGGSAISGLLLQNLQRFDPILRKKHLHVVVHSDYGLPPEATSSRAVVVCISYSGNTEETLSAYRAARKGRLPILAITSGGTLATWAKRDRVPIARIPENIPPRFSTGYQFGALIGLLVKIGFLPAVFQKETRDLEQSLKPTEALRAALGLVRLFGGRRKIPLIYSSPSLSAAAYSWKTNIHENAKLPASIHVFPELDHNELNAFIPITQGHADALSRLGIIILQDSTDAARMKKRMRVTSSLIKNEARVPVVTVPISGRSLLTRLFRAQLLGLAFSGILAEYLGIDPIPVPIIERLKTLLKK